MSYDEVRTVRSPMFSVRRLYFRIGPPGQVLGTHRNFITVKEKVSSTHLNNRMESLKESMQPDN